MIPAPTRERVVNVRKTLAERATLKRDLELITARKLIFGREIFGGMEIKVVSLRRAVITFALIKKFCGKKMG